MFNLLFVLPILKIILGCASCVAAMVLILTTPELFLGRKIKKKILLWGLILVVASSGVYCTEEKIYSELRIKAETEYAVYLDGQEVDANTISFRQYYFSINDEEKVIMLTSKRNYSYRFFPIPILH